MIILGMGQSQTIGMILQNLLSITLRASNCGFAKIAG